MKRPVFDALIVGVALFSMFFGAGNIIFPPYVGLASGSQWLLGFTYYYLADVGLALAAIFAMLHSAGIDRAEGVFVRLGAVPAKLMMGASVLCIGPLLAVPRTCATTWSIAVQPLVGVDAPWLHILFDVLYFAFVWLCSVREFSVVDILGKYLTPVFFAGLLLLIVYGGLCYLGATAPTPYSPDMDKELLITTISIHILGPFGATVLCVVVAFACLTTAIALPLQPYGLLAAALVRLRGAGRGVERTKKGEAFRCPLIG